MNDYADKISKLLRKAERAATNEEAEAFFAKAQELMVRHAITEADLDLDEDKREEIIEDTLNITGTHRAPVWQMGANVAKINGLKVMISKLERISKKEAEERTRWFDQEVKPRPHTLVLYLIGFESDVRNVKLLVQSLELQALREMRRWWDNEGRELYDTPWANNHDKNKAKHTFVGGFSDTVTKRLRDAKKRAQQEVTDERVAAASDDTEREAVSDSVALALRSRKEQVDEWYDEKYGGLTRRSRAGSYQRGGAAAGSAGRAAGARADLGQPRMKGQGRLGSGS